jgi:hypothetical protein
MSDVHVPWLTEQLSSHLMSVYGEGVLSSDEGEAVVWRATTRQREAEGESGAVEGSRLLEGVGGELLQLRAPKSVVTERCQARAWRFACGRRLTLISLARYWAAP